MKFSHLSCMLTLCTLSNALPSAEKQSTNSSKPQCEPRVVSLATGIHLNIDGQHAELAATKALQKIEAAFPVDWDAFLIQKGGLLADIAAGMTIRKYNQAVAPKDSPALAGLATYAKAQSSEQKLAESLTGEPSHDKSILATLVSDITSGTMLNMENLSNATEHCSLGFTIPSV